MGGVYSFFRTASANLRQSDDSYNEAVGGFLAGSVLGLRCKHSSQLGLCLKVDD